MSPLGTAWRLSRFSAYGRASARHFGDAGAGGAVSGARGGNLVGSLSPQIRGCGWRAWSASRCAV